MEKFIKKTLLDIGEDGNPSFYMRIAWKEAQKQLLESMDKKDIFSIKGVYLNTVYTKYIKKTKYK